MAHISKTKRRKPCYIILGILLYLLLAAESDDSLGLDDGWFSSLQLRVLYRRHDRRSVGAVGDYLSVPSVRLVPGRTLFNDQSKED